MLRRRFVTGLCCAGVIFACEPARSQTLSTNGAEQAIPISTQWTLDAAGPVQRNAITSVILLECPKTLSKGTSFVIKGGIVATASHVVEGCNAEDLRGTTTRGANVRFSRLIADPVRDLALLLPIGEVGKGLELAPNLSLSLGKGVTTWGFPLIYNGPAPILSVGYVSGYYAAPVRGGNVRHIVVNAAFNPGNSGGPVFSTGDDKVIGVVVWKSIAFSKNISVAINGFRNPGLATMGTFTRNQPDGTTVPISDQEVIAGVLEEFYTKVQVNIGEAVAVSELRAFMDQHRDELHRTN